MTKKGLADTALGAGLVFSVIGGLFGTLVLVTSAPALAEVAREVQLVRIFLAGAARPHLRGVHHHRQSAERHRLAAAGTPDRLDRPRQPGRPSAFHVRLDRTARFGRHDPDDDRHVRRVRDPALRGRHQRRRRNRDAPDRQRVPRHVGPDETLLVVDPARQRARHGDRRAAGRGRGHRGVDLVRDVEEVLEGAGEIRHRPRRRRSSSPARPTTVRWPARGSRRSYSAFPATRSPRS